MIQDYMKPKWYDLQTKLHMKPASGTQNCILLGVSIGQVCSFSHYINSNMILCTNFIYNMHLFLQFQTSEELDNSDFSLHQTELVQPANENSNETSIMDTEVHLRPSSISRYWSCIYF